MAWFRRRRGRHERATPLVTGTVPAYAVAVVPRRIELGFRDGSTADLPPGTVQWHALLATAEALTRRV